MISCKSCGGALRFDIVSQSMLCPYCDNKYDPYSIEKNSNANEYQAPDSYEATLFTCPQCGGELGSVESSAAEFCSYCGSPTVLESRLCKMKRPKYIIPFKKTKEESKEALKASLNQAFFVPKEFKDCQVDKIRGIYMPCWNYNITQKGRTSFRMNVTDPSDSDYELQYDMTAEVNASYNGIPHDASSTFADEISETLEPFCYKERLPFTPGFLAGFYSDIQDVPEEQYEKDAVNMVNRHTLEVFKSKMDPEDGPLKEVGDQRLSQLLHAELQKTDNTLIPVWFLSYRNKDRVAYAAINGETGKVVSDMPLDIKKIWAIALVIAVPLFFLMNAFISMRAGTALAIADSLVGITSILYMFELFFLDQRTDPNQIMFAKADRETRKLERKQAKKEKSSHNWKEIGCGLLIAIPVIAILAITSIFLLGFGLIALAIAGYFVYWGLCATGIILPIFAMYAYRKTNHGFKGRNLGFIALLIASIVSGVILIEDPVSDVIFYGAVIADFFAILLTLTNVLQAFNVLTTKPFPQFTIRGGESYE